MNSIVGPRPIGWISTRTTDGRRNLAPYSYFNLLDNRPPLLAFASNGWKDTVQIVQETGVFIWNLATVDLVAEVEATSSDEGRDEFDATGLTPVRGMTVKADRVAESPVAIECVATQITQLQTHNGTQLDSWLVIGEAVHIHLDPLTITNDVFEIKKARTLLRGGRPGEYFGVDYASRIQLTT
ncbi:flavin reductase family protein [Microbacterium sp. NPDC058389]|uniref:flavin reductase family protein n=1 Tax=Microbacterium sp. NPDC058389 TaxID=3346475 RepID=UPI0036576550